ncbi:MAG: SH3 domain-containing protein [Lachnospiraceae bacterium]|nr:SH3 domain-containing protein [Lachnospiraceae bacterium]
MKKRICIWALLLSLLIMPRIQTEAAESIALLETTESVEMVDAAKGSEVVAVLEAGTPVLYGGEERDGWTKITYLDMEGYVLTSTLKSYGDTEALDKEFADVQGNHQLLFEEIIRVEKEAYQSIIWGMVIIGLVVAIFAVSIVSGVKKAKEEQKYKPIYKKQKKAKLKNR